MLYGGVYCAALVVHLLNVASLCSFQIFEAIYTGQFSRAEPGPRPVPGVNGLIVSVYCHL